MSSVERPMLQFCYFIESIYKEKPNSDGNQYSQFFIMDGS